MNKLGNHFIKLTGLIPQYFYFKKKIYYEDKKMQSRNIKGKAIIISNHTSVYDYPLYLYVFFNRIIRTLTAEILYKYNIFLSHLLNVMGCIKVDRNSYDFSFVEKSLEILRKDGVVLIFPESRLKNNKKTYDGELLEFKNSFVKIALESDAPIIPCYTDGNYGKYKNKKKGSKIIIGKPIDVISLYDKNKSEKENIAFISDYVKNYIVELKNKLSTTN